MMRHQSLLRIDDSISRRRRVALRQRTSISPRAGSPSIDLIDITTELTGSLTLCGSSITMIQPADLWETWSLVSNFARDARRAATEYSRRFSCEEGFRDTKWHLGFKQARVKDIRAWSRLFTLFVLALLILVTLGTFCLLQGDQRTKELLRRVASRRRGRCELSLVSAMLGLLRQERSLLACLLSFTKFELDTTLDKVS
jgi:hypothetical protein